MKSFSIFALALFTLAAAPAHALSVGDYSIFNQTQQSNGSPITFQVKMEATAISGDDVTLTETATYQGQTIQTQTETSSLASLTANENAFDMCAAYGGTVESVTVPAGTMNACHISSNGADTYVAAGIPLGIVKQSSGADDTAVSIELVSFLKN